MATIKLTDNSSLSANASVFDTSVIGNTANSVIHFLRDDVIGALGQTLDQVQISSVAIGFDYEPSFPIAGGTATFTAGGGPTGEIDLYKPGPAGQSPLFPSDQFGADIEMGGNYYLSLLFQLAVTGSATSTPGAFTLTPAASASGSARLYLPFSAGAGGAYPTLQAALETLCSKFKLPSLPADMKAFPPGSVFVYDAQGSLGFSGSFDVLVAVNPTATLGTSTSFGPINIQASPSITIGGGFSISGEFQVRLWNRDGRVIQLGYYKKRGSTFTVSFEAGAGVNVALGKFDAIARLYSLLGDAGTLDAAWLKANIPTSVADDVKTAYQTAVQTKLSIAINEECDTAITDQVAFSWNFDTNAMDSAAHDVFASAMRGDLSRLLGNSSPLPPGVTKAGSVLDRLKDTKHTFTFNFLGLFDYANVRDASLDMSAKSSEDGQLVLADTATMTRLNATATPLIKSDLLRKVLVEEFVATIGYTSSLGAVAPDLKVNYTYYRYEDDARTSDLQVFVADAAAILGGTGKPAQDWLAMVQSGSPSQAASILASLNYDSPTGVRLFLDEAGNPYEIADLESIGRQALLKTPGLGLSEEFTSVLRNDSRWDQAVDAGSPTNFYAVMGVDRIDPPTLAKIAYSWRTHIIFWAAAMHSAGQALSSVAQYLAQHPHTDLVHDGEFSRRRQAFASQLLNVVKKTPMFDDALGIITIALTAAPVSKTVALSFAGKTTNYAIP